MSVNLILKSEAFAIIGAAMEVHSILGPGFAEAVYQEAMEIELGLRRIPYERQKKLNVRYKQYVLQKEYIADLVCHGQIIVEIKAQRDLGGHEEAQIINYLRATGLRLGLLINFGASNKLEWERFVV